MSKVSEFSILPYTKDRKLVNLENLSCTSDSDSSFDSALRTACCRLLFFVTFYLFTINKKKMYSF